MEGRVSFPRGVVWSLTARQEARHNSDVHRST
jgi:hypothetical protein